MSATMLRHQVRTHMIKKTNGEMVISLETEINPRSKVEWETWLCEGPAKGLSRQRKMQRTATGWIPSPKFKDGNFTEDIETEDSEANLSWDNYQTVRVETDPDGIPGSVNHEVTSQVHTWQVE